MKTATVLLLAFVAFLSYAECRRHHRGCRPCYAGCNEDDYCVCLDNCCYCDIEKQQARDRNNARVNEKENDKRQDDKQGDRDERNRRDENEDSDESNERRNVDARADAKPTSCISCKFSNDCSWLGPAEICMDNCCTRWAREKKNDDKPKEDDSDRDLTDSGTRCIMCSDDTDCSRSKICILGCCKRWSFNQENEAPIVRSDIG